jgi:hypothetical protein
LNQFFPPVDGFDYFLIAEGSSCDGSVPYIEGKVFVSAPDNPNRKDWAGAFSSAISALKTHVSDDECVKRISVLHAWLQERTRTSGESMDEEFIAVEFRLTRSGAVEIFSANAPGLGAGEPRWWPAEQYDRASLAYRFIRDLVHAHYHHDASDDSHTALWPAASPVSWMRRTERSLYRSVIRSRRTRDAKSTADALGRLAYLRAFQGTQSEHGEPGLREDYENLKTSLEAALHKEVMNSAQRQLRWTIFVATPFAAFGLYVALLQAFDVIWPKDLQTQAGQPPGIRVAHWALDFISHNLSLSLLTILAVGFLYFERVGWIRPTRWPLYRAYQRWIGELVFKLSPTQVMFVTAAMAFIVYVVLVLLLYLVTGN